MVIMSDSPFRWPIYACRRAGSQMCGDHRAAGGVFRGDRQPLKLVWEGKMIAANLHLRSQGRPLGSRRWVDGGGSATQEKDDFAAELRLRGLDTPNDRVLPEIEVLQRKITEAGVPPAGGPLDDRIDAFLRARDEPSG
jgi:hypothetical protein